MSSLSSPARSRLGEYPLDIADGHAHRAYRTTATTSHMTIRSHFLPLARLKTASAKRVQLFPLTFHASRTIRVRLRPVVVKTAFRVFGDQASRSDLNHWGIHPVAGLGSQFRGLHQLSLETRLDHSAIHPESGTVGCDGKRATQVGHQIGHLFRHRESLQE